jgi:hypothetical protein
LKTSLTVHPAALPPGSLVGSWRLLGLVAQGAYGLVFRAEHSVHSEKGPAALKLALQPGDPRFVREVELLSRIHHPHVPGLHDSGEWSGPGGARFPFLVMEEVDGLPLYSWARLQPRSSCQVLRLLAQLARALQAVHAAGGLHRDVKGDNILVRSADGHALLVDFGSCIYRGAPVLTRNSEPPGTPHYQSPQSQLHQWRFGRHASARYEASPADDVYALGVTAYRLVTGRYPLIADDVEVSADWGDDTFSRFPELVPAENLVHLSPELAWSIRQMLSVQPEDRGTAAELALGLELAAAITGREADRPITPRQVPASQPLAWRRWLTPAALSGALAAGVWGMAHTLPGESSTAGAREAQAAALAGDTASLGELALVEPLSAPEPMSTHEGIGEDMPDEPLPGQRLPPCKRPQIEINGGCWIRVADEAPPCVETTYEWKKRCYVPFPGSPSRPSTSGQKVKPERVEPPR